MRNSLGAKITKDLGFNVAIFYVRVFKYLVAIAYMYYKLPDIATLWKY